MAQIKCKMLSMSGDFAMALGWRFNVQGRNMFVFEVQRHAGTNIYFSNPPSRVCVWLYACACLCERLNS